MSANNRKEVSREKKDLTNKSSLSKLIVIKPNIKNNHCKNKIKKDSNTLSPNRVKNKNS